MDRIIMVGLANNKISHSEVFRRYIDCFKYFSKPDIFDLQSFVEGEEFKLDIYPQYKGPMNHTIKYFHSTFKIYNAIKQQTKYIPRNPNTKKIGYFVCESSELNSREYNTLKDFDEIWTASNYCRDVFSQYIDKSVIKVIPHPVSFPEKQIKKYKKFTILIIGNISSNIKRKNLINTIRVANLLKQKYKDINIIFKTIAGSSEERDILKNIVGNSPITVIDRYYSSDEVQNLIGKCHMVLSLHCSEGFGLTLAEALTVDTIPVATGYSGNLDFMLDSNLLIEYRLVDTKMEEFKGKWAIADVDDAFDKSEFIINNYNSGINFIKNSKNQLFQKNNKFAISHEIKKQLHNDIDWDYIYTDLIAHPNSANLMRDGGFFNPAVIKEGNKILLLSRAENISDLHKKTFFEGKADPVLFELDKNFNIERYNIIKSCNSLKKQEKIEDFRSFTYKNKNFISCTAVGKKSISPLIYEFDSLKKALGKAFIPTLLNFKPKSVEKNWAYFADKDDLYLIYSIYPYILFKQQKNFEFKKIREIDVRLPWETDFFIANSINPFEFGNYWLHIVHINTGNKNYYHYPLLINRQTLLPELYTNEPIFRKENCYGTYNNVLYLTDYIREKSKIYFFFGEGDLCITKKTMNMQELERLNWKTI